MWRSQLAKFYKIFQYTKLEDNLITRHYVSLKRRLKQLLSNEIMGDKKPKEFYRALMRLAGSSHAFSDELIKKIWFKRISNVINIYLIPQKDEEIDKVLEVADMVYEAMVGSNVSRINNRSSSSSNSYGNNYKTSNNANDSRYNKLVFSYK